MKLLIVEDDEKVVEYVSHALDSNGYSVEAANDGAVGLSMSLEGDYAALILDRMLPGLDGLTLVKQLRARGKSTPVLFLTTMSGIDDRVDGLEGGGDDYLVKPFAVAELRARVNALVRRTDSGGMPVVPTQFCVGDLKIDLIKRTVTRGDAIIDLQPQEFKLLEYLMRNAGRVVTRTMLLENVWNLHFDPRTNIVETHMSRLRAKVDRGQISDLIHTIRGTGYVLREN